MCGRQLGSGGVCGWARMGAGSMTIWLLLWRWLVGGRSGGKGKTELGRGDCRGFRAQASGWKNKRGTMSIAGYLSVGKPEVTMRKGCGHELGARFEGAVLTGQKSVNAGIAGDAV